MTVRIYFVDILTTPILIGHDALAFDNEANISVWLFNKIFAGRQLTLVAFDS